MQNKIKIFLTISALMGIGILILLLFASWFSNAKNIPVCDREVGNGISIKMKQLCLLEELVENTKTNNLSTTK